MKRLSMVVALFTTLFLVAGSGFAASISIIDVPSDPVTKNTQFNFNVLLNDASSLGNIDFFNIVLELSPTAQGVTFASFTNIRTNPNYLFYNNSFDYGVALSPYQVLIGDATASGGGVSGASAIDKLLATITVNVAENAAPGVYSLGTLQGSFFGNANADMDPIVLSSNGTYKFEVVPIPGAVWLFASGIVGLIGIGRRKK